MYFTILVYILYLHKLWMYVFFPSTMLFKCMFMFVYIFIYM